MDLLDSSSDDEEEAGGGSKQDLKCSFPPPAAPAATLAATTGGTVVVEAAAVELVEVDERKPEATPVCNEADCSNAGGGSGVSNDSAGKAAAVVDGSPMKRKHEIVAKETFEATKPFQQVEIFSRIG
jgi:hypothetical protein